MVAKAEQLEGKENPRYVVTSLGGESRPARQLYEQLYCARGEMENRFKEPLSLFSDRMSAETLRANQLRLHLSSLAYVLLAALRRLGLEGTVWARAQTETIRRGLLKIGAQVKVSVRRVYLSLAGGYPYEQAFWAVYRALDARLPPLFRPPSTRLQPAASAGISNCLITRSETKNGAPGAEWLRVSKIGNNPKNGLSRATVGAAERPAETLAPLAADDARLPPLFRPPSTRLQPAREKYGLGPCYGTSLLHSTRKKDLLGS